MSPMFKTIALRVYTMEGIIENYHMDVSENSGTPKSSILIGFSII